VERLTCQTAEKSRDINSPTETVIHEKIYHYPNFQTASQLDFGLSRGITDCVG
jgi:hypothetical protein